MFGFDQETLMKSYEEDGIPWRKIYAPSKDDVNQPGEEITLDEAQLLPRVFCCGQGKMPRQETIMINSQVEEIKYGMIEFLGATKNEEKLKIVREIRESPDCD